MPQIEILRRAREAATLCKLISDLDRTIAVIKADIDAEESQHRHRYVTDAKYPLLARHLRTRRDNLEATVRDLTARLGRIGPDPRAAVA
ncbi:hypothetical protein [Bradyrhizobium genosp. P]|uniref:hypothetical protein n=1 Tax=Bradyrhizobium genosp. P TaxID=83641 RepID=UPI003CF21186